MTDLRYRLLYDGGCGICSSVARWVTWIDVRDRIRIMPVQTSREWLPGMSDEVAFSAVHVVSPDGRVTTGGDALTALLEALPLGSGLGRLLAGSAALQRAVHAMYGFASEFRGDLTCAVDGGPSRVPPR